MVERNRVCLVMIVKNEAKILPRCLRSARPHIDYWHIVDTGSTDDTIAVAERELAGIPGRVESRPWVNFGHNRTESLALARRSLEGDGADRVWALLLDADFELVDHGFDKNVLEADVYTMLQRDGMFEYPNVRLLRMSRDWTCHGPTHEYWDQDHDSPLFESLSIVDRQDGASHSEKYTRDRKLLEDDLRSDHPETPERSVFYLAQTLEALGHPASLDLYRLRSTMGGYYEEAQLAQYRSARITLDQELERFFEGRRIHRPLFHPDESVGAPEMLTVAARIARRAEPLWRLARFYRNLDMPLVGYVFAKRAKEIPKPKQGLFVEHWAYDVGIDQELAVCSYYAGDLANGATACERLEHAGDIYGRNNAHWYAAPIAALQGKDEPAAAERGVFSVPEQMRTFGGVVYSCSNPCIVSPDLAVVRLVNYDQRGGKSYVARDADGKIRTRNAIVTPSGARVLEEKLPSGWPTDVGVLGLEDLRCCWHEDRLWFTATCCQTPGAGGSARVVLGRMDALLERVDHLTTIQYGGRCEKNWLPLSVGGDLFLVYSLSPLVLVQVDPMTGQALALARCAPWTAPGRFRGSAAPLLIDGHYVAVSHDVAYLDDGNIYTHRFVAWTPQRDVFFVTQPFLLEHRGIEYCAGMCLDGDRVKLSYGFEDGDARWVSVPVSRVVSMLGIGNEKPAA